MDREGFAQRLVALLQKKKQKNGKPMTAYQLAQEKILSSSSIENYLNLKNDPSIDNLIKLSKYFGVSIDWLITGENHQPEYLDTTPVEIPRHVYELVADELTKVGMIRKGIEEIVSILKSQNEADKIGTKDISITA